MGSTLDREGFMKQSKKHGFTLIELLVVVAIIALLIAILLPSLGKARESARRVACSAGLRSITMALKFYGDDNNQGQPLYACYADLGPTYNGNTDAMEFLYYVALAKYVGVSGVSDIPIKRGPGGRMWNYVGAVNNGGTARRSALFCRSDPVQLNDATFNPKTSAQAPWTANSSYGCVTLGWANWNASYSYASTVPAFYTGFAATEQSTFLGRTLAKRNNPSIIPIFAHQFSGNATYNAICTALGETGHWGWCGYMYDASKNIHGKLQPVSFFDGHVEIVSREEMIKPIHGPYNFTRTQDYKEGQYWSMLLY